MTSPIDYKIALEQAGGNEALAKELFGMLMQELPELHQKLGAAIAAQQQTACWDHSHRIYGSTAYCGVPDLAVAAKNMEDAVKTDDFALMQNKYQILTTEVERIMQAAPQLLQETWQ